MLLVIDDRERAVLEHEKALSGIEYETRRMENGGDYAVFDGKTLFVIIERKTFADAAASIKDGRWSNRGKMYALREACGCKVMYLIEGRRPKPTEKVNGIFWSSIESSLFHMQVRDNVGVLWARDAADTAALLSRFVRSMTTLRHKSKQVEGARETFVAQVEQLKDNPIKLITTRINTSAEDDLRKMWSRFPFVQKNIEVLMATCTLAQVFTGGIRIEAAGLPKRLASALFAPTAQLAQKVLGAVPGVSLAGAKYLLESAPIAQLLNLSLGELAELHITANSKLGRARAQDILRLFTSTKGSLSQAPSLVAEK